MQFKFVSTLQVYVSSCRNNGMFETVTNKPSQADLTRNTESAINEVSYVFSQINKCDCRQSVFISRMLSYRFLVVVTSRVQKCKSQHLPSRDAQISGEPKHCCIK